MRITPPTPLLSSIPFLLTCKYLTFCFSYCRKERLSNQQEPLHCPLVLLSTNGEACLFGKATICSFVFLFFQFYSIVTSFKFVSYSFFVNRNGLLCCFNRNCLHELCVTINFLDIFTYEFDVIRDFSMYGRIEINCARGPKCLTNLEILHTSSASHCGALWRMLDTSSLRALFSYRQLSQAAIINDYLLLTRANKPETAVQFSLMLHLKTTVSSVSLSRT